VEHVFAPQTLRTALFQVQNHLEVIDLDSPNDNTLAVDTVQAVDLISFERSLSASTEGEFRKRDETIDPCCYAVHNDTAALSPTVANTSFPQPDHHPPLLKVVGP